MSAFLVAAAAMAIAAVAFLAWPLLRPPRDVAGEGAGRAGVAATAVAALLPVAAFAAYFWASHWEWDETRRAAAPATPGIEQMVAQLEARLAQQPDDVEGWKMLGRSSAVLGNYAKARSAFGEAYTRSRGQDPQAVVGYAEALVLNDEREIDGQAAQLFERALELDPENLRALWYGGIVAYRRGDLELAQRRWVELQNQELAPELRQVVAEQLAGLEREGVAPAPADEPAGASTAVQLRIDVAPALRDSVQGGATLYVIARRGTGGPPLAVVRRPAGPWPLPVRITDADAMLPGTSLAGGGTLQIVARVSQQGGPIAASGDLQGEVGYDPRSTGPVSLTIDRIVP